jgi:signal transduction histidine kinase
MSSVFLSHNFEDKTFARKLATDLRLAGARVWLDEAEIKLGDSLIDKISEGINETEYLAVVLSPHSVQSSWVRRELDIALNREIAGRKITVLPLLYQECDIPAFLRGKLYADFREGKNYTRALNLIKERLGLPLTESTEKADESLYNTEVMHLLKGSLALIRDYAERALERQRTGAGPDRELEILGMLTRKPLIVLEQFNSLRFFEEGRYQLRADRASDVRKIVERIVRDFSVLGSDRKLDFRIVAERSQSYVIPVDRGLIEVAFYNLLDNALKYSFKNSVIQVRLTKSGTYVDTTITSVGLTIDESEKQAIFNLGYRGQHARLVTAEGSGRGLHFARLVVEAHGGTIDLVSDDTRDTNSFRVRLPVAY